MGVLADSRLSVSQPRGQTSAPRGASNTAQADGQRRGSSRGVQHCVASAGALSAVLGPTISEGCEGTRMHLEEGNKAVGRAGGSVL